MLEKTYPNVPYSNILLISVVAGVSVAEEHRLTSMFIERRRVIELRPGPTPLYQLFQHLGVAEYVAVEPFNPTMTREKLPSEIEVVEEDGLTYLLKQPDNSAIVVSCGVIDPTLYGKKQPPERTLRIMMYYQFLADEIYRVTPPGDISIHTGHDQT